MKKTKNCETCADGFAQALAEDRKKIMQIIDDYYDLFFDEFTAKYNLPKNSDLMQAKRIFRLLIEQGKLTKGA